MGQFDCPQMIGRVRIDRLAACLVALATLSACTTLQPSQVPPDAIREGIRDGYLLEAGDTVGFVTKDGTEHVIRVLEVDSDHIRGTTGGGAPGWLAGESAETVEIPIDDVLALRTEQLEPVRSSFAAMGGTAVLSLGALFLLSALSR